LRREEWIGGKFLVRDAEREEMRLRHYPERETDGPQALAIGFRGGPEYCRPQRLAGEALVMTHLRGAGVVAEPVIDQVEVEQHRLISGQVKVKLIPFGDDRVNVVLRGLRVKWQELVFRLAEQLPVLQYRTVSSSRSVVAIT
jgi:hypothetical protein